MLPEFARSRVLAFALGLALLLGGGDSTGSSSIWGPEGIRFGYSSRLLFEVSRQDAQAALALWTRELFRLAGLDTPPQAKIYEDTPSLVSAISRAELDFIALPCLDYLKIRDRVRLEPALAGMKNGILKDEMVLLVRRESGLDRMEKLQGKTLFIMAGAGEITSLWLDTILYRNSLRTTERFFGEVKEAGKGQQAILPVFFRKADACVVSRNAFTTAAELNPQIGRELVVLAASPPLPTGITCFRADLSESKKNEFIRIYGRLVHTPTGRQILTLFKVDAIVPVPTGFLDGLEKMVKEAERVREGAKTQRRGPA